MSGVRGKSGPKPVEFITRCSALADSLVLPKVQRYLTRADKGPHDPGWRWAAEWVTQYGKGKPAQTVEHSGPDGDAIPVALRSAGEAFDGRVARLAERLSQDGIFKGFDS